MPSDEVNWLQQNDRNKYRLRLEMLTDERVRGRKKEQREENVS